VPGFVRRHAVKLVASALLTLGVIYTARHTGIELVPDHFTGVRWSLIALYIPLLLAMTWFRAMRWRFLLRPIIEVPTRRLLAVSCAGFLAIVLMPFRLGELVRPYMMHTRREDRRPGRPVLTMTAATSSVIAERIIDGMFLSVMLAIVLVYVPTVHPLPERVIGLPISVAQVRAAGWVMFGLFSVALATIALFYFARTFAQRVIRATVGRFSARIADKLADFAGHAADGLQVFQSRRDALGFLAESAMFWACNTVGLWIVGIGCGIVHADGSPLTFAEACGLQGMLGVAMLIPAPPGLLGIFQVGLYAGMTMYVPREVVIGSGTVYVFLVYALQLVVQLILGVWGVLAAGGAGQLREAIDRSALERD